MDLIKSDLTIRDKDIFLKKSLFKRLVNKSTTIKRIILLMKEFYLHQRRNQRQQKCD